MGVRGYHPPATRGKGVRVPQGIRHVEKGGGVPSKKANFSTKLVEFLTKSQFFPEIFGNFLDFGEICSQHKGY